MNASVEGGVKWILRVEGLAVLVAGILVYQFQQFSWLNFAVLFLLPDLAMIGYLLNAKVGAIAYNIAHSYIGPILLLVIGFGQVNPIVQMVGIIWLAHIGFDRALGYGLKYTEGFSLTHLGQIGKANKIV